MEIKRVTTDEFEMEYVTFGKGKKPFVIIPGLSIKSVMLSADAVSYAYDDFTTGYTVYLFDRRNDIPTGHTVCDMADDIAESMKILGISDAYVFGASQGGMIAQCIAIKYPELVKKAVLGSSASRMSQTAKKVIANWIELAKKGDVVSLNRNLFENIYSEEYFDKYREVFAFMENDATSEELKKFTVCAEACLNFDVYSELDKIKCPLFAIASRKDKVLPCESSFEIANKTGCEIYIYDGYSHAVYDEAPDYRKRILQFFSE